ncbi:MAG: arginine--tRNA ligase, partial [Thermoplasmatales archaeon]|nr:arginine--tRNA ligase [Thermoplasmatales archaeon]
MSYPLNEAEKEVISLLEKALSQRSIGLTKQSYKKLFKTAKLELPPENMGDFAFPCFILASELKKAPNDLAKDIATKIEKGKWVEKIEANGPYVNFFINIEHLKNLTIKSVLSKQKNYGNLENKNKKAIIEHTSANPNGPLHVGRARNPIIGDTIVRIFKAAGYDVESQFYLDD